MPTQGHVAMIADIVVNLSVREGGKPVTESRDFQLVRSEGSATVYTAGSGTYSFSCPQ